MNERLIKLIQKNKIKNIISELKGIQFISMYDLEEDENKIVKQYLMGISKNSYPTHASCIVTRDLVDWIINQLENIGVMEDIIVTIPDCYKWMCRVKVTNWKCAIQSLLRMGGICFYSVDLNIGFYIGFSEDICFLNIKRNEEGKEENY